MQKFITQYPNNGKMYGSHVYANDISSAQNLCWKRSIGEVILGVGDSVGMQKALTDIEVLHESCFLCYICLKAGLMPIEEVLGDGGIVHELSHTLAHNDNACTIDELMARVIWLRKLTPGYEPV